MHLCTSPLLPSSPLCGAQRAYKAPLLSVTAAYAASTAHGVAASQRHVPSQRKPTSLAALGTPLHDKQQRRNKTASVTTRLDSKAWLETLVVVEGLSDQCAVRKAVPAQVSQTALQPPTSELAPAAVATAATILVDGT